MLQGRQDRIVRPNTEERREPSLGWWLAKPHLKGSRSPWDPERWEASLTRIWGGKRSEKGTERRAQKTDQHQQSPLSLDKGAMQYGGEWIFVTDGAGTAVCPYATKLKSKTNFTPCTNFNPKWIIGLKVKPKTIKLLEENRRKSAWSLVWGWVLHAHKTKSRIHERKIYINWTLSKSWQFALWKIPLRELTDKPPTDRKYLQITNLIKNMYPE